MIIIFYGSFFTVINEKLIKHLKKAINRSKNVHVRELLLGFADEVKEKKIYFKGGFLVYDLPLFVTVSIFNTFKIT